MNIATAIVVSVALLSEAILHAEPPHEIVIQAKPKFRTKDHLRKLIVSDGENSCEIGWAAVQIKDRYDDNELPSEDAILRAASLLDRIKKMGFAMPNNRRPIDLNQIN